VFEIREATIRPGTLKVKVKSGDRTVNVKQFTSVILRVILVSPRPLKRLVRFR